MAVGMVEVSNHAHGIYVDRPCLTHITGGGGYGGSGGYQGGGGYQGSGGGGYQAGGGGGYQGGGGYGTYPG